ncbi:MAG TPA: flagellar hook protein FlgE [Acidobacteriota bacterium]|nr:flagellar hook protein FlgE [Acidobacteriota bacterium]
MGGAFFTGLSGLVANSLGIEVVGNNLSNSNTVGYKVNNIHFQELISANNQLLKLGQGATAERISETFSQGSLQDSQIPTDMAIQGQGFFVVGDGVNSQFYTRAGNFQISPDGFLTNSEGLFVMGYPAIDGQIDRTADLRPIQIVPDNGLDPLATSLIRFGGNLNVDTPEGEAFNTSISVFDSLGEDHQITLQFTRTASGWDFEVQIPAEDVGGAEGDPPTVLESGSITFDGDGRIDTVTTSGGALPAGSDVTGITISGLANGANDLTFDWDLFNQDGEGFVTQFNLPSETQLTFQDGNGAGTLTGLVVRRNGVIEGLFSNGETSPLGQLAMAKFTNPQGMVKVASNLYSKTAQSGDASIGEPGTGGRGVIRGNALESSNVDIAEEFVKLIIFQRAYQANSRLVVTADEVVQEAIALKR